MPHVDVLGFLMASVGLYYVNCPVVVDKQCYWLFLGNGSLIKNNNSVSYAKSISINNLFSMVILSPVKLHKYLVFYSGVEFYSNFVLG